MKLLLVEDEPHKRDELVEWEPLKTPPAQASS